MRESIDSLIKRLPKHLQLFDGRALIAETDGVVLRSQVSVLRIRCLRANECIVHNEGLLEASKIEPRDLQ